MSCNEDDELRSTAALLINRTRAMSYRGGGGSGGGGGGGGVGIGVGQLPYDITRANSHINMFTEELLAGYIIDGRMSVVRRFFCLFVTFDLFFVSLLWLICIMITGDNIFIALQKQILHYTIYTSLFDVVAASICRFIVLIFFYALLAINHWWIIALSTSSSCLFLISKVFVFDWVDSSQQVFVVILIITSFVLAWGEAWFLDCRVIPQERHARRFFDTITSSLDRSMEQMGSFLSSHGEIRPPESVANFYSPLDSTHNSDEEADLDEEYHQMGLDCVRKAHKLFESSDWKVEKVTSDGDTIKSTQRDKLGKIYRLTARIKYPAKALLDELFYKIDDVPKWNPTLLESKMVRKVNSYTDITYQASVGGGGGLVKSRDFVNLRCWRLFRNGNMCEDEIEENHSSDDENLLNCSLKGSVSTISDTSSITPLPSSVGSVRVTSENKEKHAVSTLSKSLGAKDFGTAVLMQCNETPPPLEEEFVDAYDHDHREVPSGSGQSKPLPKTNKDKVWISSAISVNYAAVPPNTSKYIRGENIITAFAFREIAGKPDACIFEWVLCLDLKGYVPRYVLETAYTTFMQEYMTYLRKYVSELRNRSKHHRVATK